MLLFERLSIKRKLTTIVMVTCCIAVLMACIIFVAFDRIAIRKNLVDDLTILAGILGSNCTAAITFASEADAAETLSGLKAEPHIISACIFTRDGRLFAGYIRDGESADILPTVPQPDGYAFGKGRLTLYRSILLNDKRIGTLYMNKDLREMEARLNRYIVTMALVMLAALFVAFIVISNLQRIIVGPVQHLAEVARTVSTLRDYSIRATAYGKDEIGLLVNKFNEMLANIQQRDAALQEARDGLEQRVLERTRELEIEIAERKHAESALRESGQLLRATLESTGDGILVVAESGQVTHVNERFMEMWLINEQPELLTDRDCLQRCMLSQLSDPEKVFADAALVYNTNGETSDIIHFRDGRVFEMYSCQLTKGNTTTGRVWSFRDITERVRHEEQRRQLQEQLERAERMESVGMLAGGVAHDLNNMLGPIVGYSDLILMDIPEDSAIGARVERIGKAARDAADVIQDLLTLARRGRYEMTLTNINDVVLSYLDSPGFMELSRKHPEISIDLSLDEQISLIDGSSSHLSKVIMNLVINAFDAMPDGGTVTISTSEQYLHGLRSGQIRLTPGSFVALRVSDTGTGIDSKDLEKIFEPYYSKKKMGASGSGLGLSVVYGVVKDHKAYYDVFSEMGRGTEFIIYFPVAIKQENVGTSGSVINLNGSERVLVVDDVPEQRLLATDILNSLGYVVNTAANGREAVEYLRRNTADIVLLDMIMERDFDGLDTFREIIKIRPDQKAVIVSGFSATDRVEQMQQLGAGNYIKKPYTRETIGRAIREELDKPPTDSSRSQDTISSHSAV